jgi:uncharacterized protein YbjT (DUF2867 family)
MILVTGATGLNGGELVRKLSSRGVKVRALVRNRAKAAALEALPGVEVVEGDLSRPESLRAPLAGGTRAMLVTSSDPGMLEVQGIFVTAAKEAGVQYLVKLSGIMPDVDSPFRFARMHGEIEKRIEASGMQWTHLRPGEFMHSYFRTLPGILARGELRLPMADARIACIDVGDIAEAAAKILTTPGHEGKRYPITGPESLSMNEVAEKLSAATGKTIRYVAVDPEDARKAQLSAGLPPFLADGLFELFAERRKGKEATVMPGLGELGIRPTPFSEFAARYAAVFRGEQPPPKA